MILIKLIAIFVFGVFILSCSKEPVVPEDKDTRNEVKETIFPYNDEYQENNGSFQARVAYPLEDGKVRIWVKGSAELNYVTVENTAGEIVKKDILLEEPFFTKIFSFDDVKKVIVKFSNKKIINNHGIENSIVLYPQTEVSLRKPSDTYSIAFYGCFQPFTTTEGNSSQNLEAIVYEGKNGFAPRFLKFFKDTVLYNKTDEDNTILLPNTKLIIGTGDQVYVDAGYDKHPPKIGKYHPLSAWTSEKQPRLLQKGEDFEAHIEKMYRAFGSFKDMNEVFHKVPQLNVWDDHEIRDGWGSQGDESDCNMISAYHDARMGYLEHQFLIGPNEESDKYKENHFPLDQTFEIGEYSGYAFDLRSNRNIKEESNNTVISDNQLKDFKSWLFRQNKNQKIIIISSIPLFLGNNALSEKAAAKFENGELVDDIADGWGSTQNEKQRDEIIKLLFEARNDKNIMPIIVSGDYHKGALSEIWYYNQNGDPNEKKVLAYEILATGIYHEGLNNGTAKKKISKRLTHHSEAQRVGEHLINTVYNDINYTIEPFVKISESKENFAGISFDGNKTILKLFLGNESDNTASVWTLNTMWDKNYKAEDEMYYTMYNIFLNIINPFTWGGNRYITVRPPDKNNIEF